MLKGLVDEFGKDRIIDTPISEAGFTGLGVGAAMTGMRPIVDIMFGDFLTLIMDQMVNQAAKIHYMSGGKWKVPMVIRATMGATRRLGGAALAVAARVAEPHPRPEGGHSLDAVRRQGTPQGGDSRRQPGRLLRGQDQLHKVKGPVPDEDYVIPLGVADVKREGRDITLVAHEQHGAGGARRGDDARGDRHQRGSGRSAHDLAARREDADRIGRRRRLAASSSTRATTATASPARSPRSFRKARSTISTVRCGGSARCTCRFRSRRRSRMSPCRPNADDLLDDV